MKWRHGLVLCGLASLIGCGGSQSAGLPEGGTGTVVAGPLTVQGNVSAPVVANPSGGAAAYGLAGNITAANLTMPNNSLAGTEIVYSREGVNGYEIAACEPDGGGYRSVLANIPTRPTEIKVHPSGQYVYYIRSNTLTRVSNVGGSILTISANVRSFAFTPSGNTIVVSRTNSDQIQTLSMTGTVLSTIGTYAGPSWVVGCLKEDSAIVVKQLNPNFDWYTLALSPGAPLVWRQTAGSITNPFHPFSMENTTPSIYVPSNRMRVYPTTSASSWLNPYYYPSSTSTLPAALSPNGFKIAGSSTTQRGGLTVRDLVTQSEVLVRSEMIDVVAWSPILTSKAVVGTGSIFGTAAIGALLFSEGDSHVRSFVAADATTRTSIVVTPQAAGGGSAVFQIQGDRLTKLQYTNGNAFAVSSVDVGTTVLKGAVVAFDGVTGKLTTLLTYNKAPTFKRFGKAVEVIGDCYDVLESRQVSRASVR